jgi:RNA polymerase sigma-70 factor (ECF subfamily)
MSDKSVCKEENFNSLFKEHISDVRNFMFYKTGDLENAEDLAQDAFIKMWNNCSQVVFSKAKSFLFTVANRLFLNTVRHEKVKLSFVKMNPSKNTNETPESLMEENEFKTKLEAAISALPEKQREVFLMNRIDKMSYSEIAEALEISVKAVEKRMGICLKKLKSTVEELNIYKI